MSNQQAWFMVEIERLKNELREEREKVAELEKYLRSAKFEKDPTVQVVDVLTRMGRY